ncbi:hypothetical protein HYH02_008061 [Chlamydomonas schloesseri]|uniref:Uncharacterized protein n=1 Tax=Chlamydomonas schloesseri TaxID=2026947 RepID=A0A835WGA2_9CHLO|nr:hypothetical protein HYH02_008061 [Chlamydomonas schloesseri]|eukprot:KAG2446905.1 hypothetical protein HYH02_008061 [Chlamydomonas schloesseri]
MAGRIAADATTALTPDNLRAWMLPKKTENNLSKGAKAFGLSPTLKTSEIPAVGMASTYALAEVFFSAPEEAKAILKTMAIDSFRRYLPTLAGLNLCAGAAF